MTDKKDFLITGMTKKSFTNHTDQVPVMTILIVDLFRSKVKRCKNRMGSERRIIPAQGGRQFSVRKTNRRFLLFHCVRKRSREQDYV